MEGEADDIAIELERPRALAAGALVRRGVELGLGFLVGMLVTYVLSKGR